MGSIEEVNIRRKGLFGDRSVILAWQGRQFVAKAHVLQRVYTAGGALFPGDRLKSGPRAGCWMLMVRGCGYDMIIVRWLPPGNQTLQWKILYKWWSSPYHVYQRASTIRICESCVDASCQLETCWQLFADFFSDGERILMPRRPNLFDWSRGVPKKW